VTAVYNTMYYFGATLGGWITYATLRIPSHWSWRLPSLLQAAPSIVQVFLVLLLPESPRWLVAHDKPERALQILAKYHANGNENDESVRFEFNEVVAAIKAEKEKSKGSLLDLFRTSKS
jgi:MFS family permease